jgi:hypothetical protein
MSHAFGVANPQGRNAADVRSVGVKKFLVETADGWR